MTRHFGLADLEGIVLPVITPPCPVRRNPWYESVRGDFHAWLFSLSLFPSDQEQRIRSYDYPLGASLCGPQADRDRLWDLSTATAVISLRDDEFETEQYRESRRKLQSALTAAHHGHTTAEEETRWGPVFAGLWSRLTAYVPPGQLQRLSNAIARQLQGCLDTADHLRRHGGFDDFQHFLDLRRATNGHQIIRALVEISIGVDLGEQTADPLFAEVNRCEDEQIIAIDGLLSLRKELAQQENYEENLVIVLARSQNLNLQDAVDAIQELYQQALARRARAVEALHSTPLGQSSDVRAYLSAMNDFIAGLGAYLSQSARYGNTVASTSVSGSRARARRT